MDIKTDSSSSSDIAALRRARILDAAETLFVQHGIRGVTMEAAAEAARVAKATLYSYFRNKDALFQGVSQRLAQNLTSAFTAALATESEIGTRARAALAGKHLRVFEIVRGSAHARELFSAKDRLAREIFEAADREMIASLAASFAGEAEFAPRAAALARALFFGVNGLADQCADASTLASEIGGFVDTYLAGARITAGPPSQLQEA